jgi:stress response protein SCP2
MSVNLQKGQKVDLTKGNAGLKKVMLGLGWDEAAPEAQSKGFLGGLVGGNKRKHIDCDASALMLSGEKLAGTDDIVYFGNLNHSSGAVRHQGDNLTGEGEGDDEQIIVDLKDIPAKYDKIVFVVNIYKAAERGQHFGMIRNAFIRVVNADNGQELYKYNLSESCDGMTAMIFGEVYRHNGEWKFSAIGQGTQDKGISELAQRYR